MRGDIDRDAWPALFDGTASTAAPTSRTFDLEHDGARIAVTAPPMDAASARPPITPVEAQQDSKVNPSGNSTWVHTDGATAVLTGWTRGGGACRTQAEMRAPCRPRCNLGGGAGRTQAEMRAPCRPRCNLGGGAGCTQAEMRAPCRPRCNLGGGAGRTQAEMRAPCRPRCNMGGGAGRTQAEMRAPCRPSCDIRVGTIASRPGLRVGPRRRARMGTRRARGRRGRWPRRG
jgi:hypothetical protein